MLIFLDETFRTNKLTGETFGVLAGVSVPEDVFSMIQRDWRGLCKPYFGTVLTDGHEVKGSRLLTGTTLKIRASGKYSPHWSMAEDLLNYAHRQRIRVFGVTCFHPRFQSFVCDDDRQLHMTYRFLYERIDLYMREMFPKHFATLVFDDRGTGTNAKNARATTNFFLRSTLGTTYDTIIKTPFFGVSQANNCGLELADVVTTVIGHKFQGSDGIDPLWRRIQSMLYRTQLGERKISSLRVLRPPTEKDPAAE